MTEFDYDTPYVRVINISQDVNDISVSFEKISEKFKKFFSSVKYQTQGNKILTDYAVQLEQRVLGNEKFLNSKNDKDIFVEPYGTLATLKMKTKSDTDINYLNSSFRALKRTEKQIDRDLRRFSRSNEEEKFLILDAVSEIDAELDRELYLISKENKKRVETFGDSSGKKYAVSFPQITRGKGLNNESSRRNKIFFAKNFSI